MDASWWFAATASTSSTRRWRCATRRSARPRSLCGPRRTRSTRCASPAAPSSCSATLRSARASRPTTARKEFSEDNCWASKLRPDCLSTTGKTWNSSDELRFNQEMSSGTSPVRSSVWPTRTRILSCRSTSA
uniref:(northern house mosquito) hypothetical protein n=1 Tax=Culex pipiens TaxID=7175 RepID=A0A8D8L274_CULPI